jgi:predicted DNA-binding transcriptional regulator YafY
MADQKPSKQELKKLKLLYLLHILQRETDEDHGLTSPQIIAKLAEKGVEVERKTLYRDFECLRHAGYDVQKYAHRRPVQYALIPHDFQPEDLSLMADAVQSSKSITEAKARELVGEIGSLGSRYLEANLGKRIHVAGRIGYQSRSVFYAIDTIQRAIDSGHKVAFTYWKYDEHKQRVAQHGAMIYRETPVYLLYKSGLYYLITWRDQAAPGEQADFRTYRIDRMQNVEEDAAAVVSNEAIKAFDIKTYLEQTFDMFTGQPTDTLLRVNGSVMSSVIDRFGEGVRVVQVGDGCATVNVIVRPAPTFFGWLAQFGTDIVIEQPADLRQQYAAYLDNIVAAYRA